MILVNSKLQLTNPKRIRNHNLETLTGTWDLGLTDKENK